MLVPIIVSVGVGDGMLLSRSGVCPWAGDLTMVGVFDVIRETVLIALSEPVRRMAVFLCVGTVTALRFGESGFCTTRTRRGRVCGTLTFFFRLRPLPPRLPRFVFLSRTLFFFFFFPGTSVVSEVSPGAAHNGRTPAEAV